MARPIEQLKTQASTIRTATSPGSNTAERVGSAFQSIAQYLENNTFAQFEIQKTATTIAIRAFGPKSNFISAVILREASETEAGIMTAQMYSDFNQAKEEIATLKRKAESPSAGGAWAKWTKKVKIGRGQTGNGNSLQVLELPENAAPAAFFVSIVSNNGGRAFFEGVLFASRSDNQCELRSARQIGAQIAEEVQAGVYYNGDQAILRVKPHPRRSPEDQEWTITVLCSDPAAKAEFYFAEQPMQQKNTLSFN